MNHRVQVNAVRLKTGWVSMENTPVSTASTDRWAFVKLNRVSPNSDAQQRA
jgi:hypothetical protein